MKLTVLEITAICILCALVALSSASSLAQATAFMQTNSAGTVTYSTLDVASGLKESEVYSTDNGYSTVEQAFSTNVVDYNGRIVVTATDPSGAPLPYARVYRDNAFQAFTDSNGRADLFASQGPAAIKVNCPDDSACYAQNISVTGTQFMKASCSCDLGNPATLTILGVNSSALPAGLPAMNNVPVAFAAVSEGSLFLGFTDFNGSLYLPHLFNGPHTFTVDVCVKGPAQEKCTYYETALNLNRIPSNNSYQFSLDASTLFNPVNKVQATDYAGPGTVLKLSNHAIRGQILPLVIGVAVAAIWVYSVYTTGTQLNDCLRQHPLTYSLQYGYSASLMDCGSQAAFFGLNFIPIGALADSGVQGFEVLGTLGKDTVSNLPGIKYLLETEAVQGLGDSAAGAWKAGWETAQGAHSAVVHLTQPLRSVAYDVLKFLLGYDQALDASLARAVENSPYAQHFLASYNDLAVKAGLGEILTSRALNDAGLRTLENTFGGSTVAEAYAAAGQGVYDASKVSPSTIAMMIKADKSISIDFFAEDKLGAVKVAGSPSLEDVLQIGGQQFPKITLLQRGIVFYDASGNPIGGFGLERIWAEHSSEFAQAYDLTAKEKAANFIETALGKMQPTSAPQTYAYQPPTGPALMIVMGNTTGTFGTVIDAYPSG